jgi:hypothetical protein
MNVKMLHSLTRFSRPRTRLVVSPPRCRTFCSKPIPSLLRPPARESSAKFGGILLAYPDLRLEVDGHTDSTGSGEYNQQLSEKRAASVRDYLVQHGIPISSVAVMGSERPPRSPQIRLRRDVNRIVESSWWSQVKSSVLQSAGNSRPQSSPQDSTRAPVQPQR